MRFKMTKRNVFKDDKKAGKVTSAVYSPRLKKNIGYAWPPIGLSELGNKIDVESPNGKVTAEVVAMPFIDPGKEIPKA